MVPRSFACLAGKFDLRRARAPIGLIVLGADPTVKTRNVVGHLLQDVGASIGKRSYKVPECPSHRALTA
jgi:hypothetical protein